MRYIPPIGGAADDPYVDAAPAAGIEGSRVAAAAVEHPQREVVNVITFAGLTPDPTSLTQLRQAIQAMIAAAMAGIGSLVGYAQLAVAQVWTRTQSCAVATLEDGASIAWALPTAQMAKVTIAASRTLANPTGQVAGTRYSLRIIHGAANTYLSYGSAYKGLAGLVLSSGAGAVDVLTWESDGATMSLVGVAHNVTA